MTSATTRKKNNVSDEFYEGKGIEIPDKNATGIVEMHEYEKKMEKAISEAASEMNMKPVTKTVEKMENGTQPELPLRVAYAENKVALSKVPVWYLTALGSLSVEELNEFRVKYGSEMSLNEQIALNLLDGAMVGDKDAVKTFWDIQQKMLMRTNIANQINISVKNNDKSVTSMLDTITERLKNQNLICNPVEGEVAGNDEDTPTP